MSVTTPGLEPHDDYIAEAMAILRRIVAEAQASQRPQA